MFSFWMVWYGVQRFLIDFTRLGAARDGVVRPDGVTVETIADSVMGPFTGSQWGGLGTAALGLLLLLWTRRYQTVTAEGDVELGAEPIPVAGSPARPEEPQGAAEDPSPSERDTPQ
jgi:hypothetical protein